MDILIDDLFYIYERNFEKVVALRGLHLTVATGECLAIKGPNGSGKSTLVKLMTGFYTPTAGRILIGSQDISEIDPLRLRREFVSSIDQRGNLLGDIIILENIALAYVLVGRSLSSSRKLANDLLTTHGLEHLAHRYPDQLSAGERQFSSLLAAIATNPKVLIADEPSGELDNKSAEVMYQLLKSLAGDTSVILVTHDVRAENYADRVVRIREGRISEEWKPGEDEHSVIDPFGWMRVREMTAPAPARDPKTSTREPGNLLRGVDLELSYGNKEIFSKINVEGTEGELIAFSSVSGSGKSSLLRILAGIQDPTKGEVFVKGIPLKNLTREERADLRNEIVSFLGQGGSTVSNISLADHLAGHHLDLGDLYRPRLNRPVSAFSGGERARIELLKTLSERKAILLLDEPTSQMDEPRSAEATDLILNCVKDGALVIVSTREESLLQSANRVISLDEM